MRALGMSGSYLSSFGGLFFFSLVFGNFSRRLIYLDLLWLSGLFLLNLRRLSSGGFRLNLGLLDGRGLGRSIRLNSGRFRNRYFGLVILLCLLSFLGRRVLTSLIFSSRLRGNFGLDLCGGFSSLLFGCGLLGIGWLRRLFSCGLCLSRRHFFRRRFSLSCLFDRCRSSGFRFGLVLTGRLLSLCGFLDRCILLSLPVDR
jgi:hypothetical protein